MNALARALSAEALKLRRTLALWITAAAPLLVVLFQVLNVLERGHAPATRGLAAWDPFIRGSLSLWALFMLPLFIALETALLADIEHGQHMWRHLFALPTPRWSIFAAKQLTALLAVLTATAVLACGTLIGGWTLALLAPGLGFTAAPDVALLLRGAAMLFLASWILLALQSWVALRWPSLTLALGVGIGGTFVALFAAGSRMLRYFPWSLPVHALGAAPAATPAVVLGLGGGIVVGVLALLELSRRDVR